MKALACLVATVAIIAVVPHVITSRYWLHVINLSLIYVPLAIGANVITRVLRLWCPWGRQRFFGIGAYTSALLTMRLGPALAARLRVLGHHGLRGGGCCWRSHACGCAATSSA